MSRSLVAVSLSLLAGCGGAFQTDLFSDASTTDGGAGTDGSTTDGGGDDARSDGPAVDCKTLIGNVNDLRNNLMKCNPQSPTPVCDIQVEDLCCPLTVNGPPSRKEVLDFEAAWKAAKACQVGCPATPCLGKPSLQCLNGSCLQF